MKEMSSLHPEFLKSINDSIALKQKISDDTSLLVSLESAIEKITHCFNNNGKVLFCGNGGSAADAQHLAAELSGRFYYDRPALPAEALQVNSSFVTAVANDYGYDYVFARMVEAWGKPGDILVALSTSGNSPVIVKAVETARRLGMLVIGFTGQGGGSMASACDILFNVPSTDTPRIQESHILIGHLICEHVEKKVFPVK